MCKTCRGSEKSQFGRIYNIYNKRTLVGEKKNCATIKCNNSEKMMYCYYYHYYYYNISGIDGRFRKLGFSSSIFVLVNSFLLKVFTFLLLLFFFSLYSSNLLIFSNNRLQMFFKWMKRNRKYAIERSNTLERSKTILITTTHSHIISIHICITCTQTISRTDR